MKVLLFILLCASSVFAQGISMDLSTPYVVPSSYSLWHTDGDPPKLTVRNDRTDSFFCTISALIGYGSYGKDTFAVTPEKKIYAFAPGTNTFILSQLIPASEYIARIGKSLETLQDEAFSIFLQINEISPPPFGGKVSMQISAGTAVHSPHQIKNYFPKSDSLFYKNDSITIQYEWPTFDTITLIKIYHCSAKYYISSNGKILPDTILYSYRMSPWEGRSIIRVDSLIKSFKRPFSKKGKDTIVFVLSGMNFNDIPSHPIQLILTSKEIKRIPLPNPWGDLGSPMSASDYMENYDYSRTFIGGIIEITTDSGTKIYNDPKQKIYLGSTAVLLLKEWGKPDTIAYTKYTSYSGAGDDATHFWHPTEYSEPPRKEKPPVISESDLVLACTKSKSPYWGLMARFDWHPDQPYAEHRSSSKLMIEGLPLQHDLYSPLQYSNGFRYNCATKIFEHISTLRFRGIANNKPCWATVIVVRKD